MYTHLLTFIPFGRAKSGEIYCGVELIIFWDVVECEWVVGGRGRGCIESFHVFIIRPLALAQSCIS